MLESVMEQKMAFGAYGSDGSITVLTSTQLQIAAKVISILSPIEEIKEEISALKHNISSKVKYVCTRDIR